MLACLAVFFPLTAVPFYAAQQLHRLDRIPRQLRGATKPVVVTTSRIGEPVSNAGLIVSYSRNLSPYTAKMPSFSIHEATLSNGSVFFMVLGSSEESEI